MDAFCCYTHLDPKETENSNTVVLASINQSAPDIRRKLQNLERPGEKSLRGLVEDVEKVCHNRETKEKKKIQAGKIVNRDLAKVLLANGNLDQRERERRRQLQNIAEGREPKESCQPEPRESLG